MLGKQIRLEVFNLYLTLIYSSNDWIHHQHYIRCWEFSRCWNNDADQSANILWQPTWLHILFILYFTCIILVSVAISKRLLVGWPVCWTRIILYYRSRDQDVQFLNKLSKIYLLLNLVVYSIYFALLAMLFTLPTNDVAKIVHPIEVAPQLLVRTQQLRFI